VTGRPSRWGKKTGEGREEEGERADGGPRLAEREKGEEGGRGSGLEIGPAWPTRGKRGRGEWAAGERAGPRGREGRRAGQAAVGLASSPSFFFFPFSFLYSNYSNKTI
jgi:hypothetical protein